jgi:hypothetical protein
MKRNLVALLVCILLLIPSYALAQDTEPPLRLALRRTFGYGGLGQIQGTFTLKVDEIPGLVRVEFLIDDEVVSTDNEAAFDYRFNTGSFPDGDHIMSAIGYLESGETLASNTYAREFLSAEEAWGATTRFVIPFLVGLGLLTLAGVGVTFLLGRGKEFRPGEYGLAGGAVCRRCQNPFSRHIWSPNIVAGKLERCPHCGKWAIVRRATSSELEAAEGRYASEGTLSSRLAESEEDQMRRLIDESRFEE